MEDPRTANWLSKHGYACRFTAGVPLNRIDMAEAEANPARLTKKLDEDRVLQYSLEMTGGTDFPAIVLLDPQIVRGGAFSLITGRHRIEAALLAGFKTLDAYVVRETDPFRRELILRTINNLEGKAPSFSEKMAHLFELRRNYPDKSLRELAALFGMKQGTVNEYIRADNTYRRASALGVAERVLRLPATVRADLDAIKNDNTFVATLKLLHRHYALLRGSPTKALLSDVRAANTEEKAAKVLAERETELSGVEEEQKTKGSRTPRTAASTFMGRVRTLTKFNAVEELHLEGLPAAELSREQRVVDDAIVLLGDARDRMAELIEQHRGEAEWRKDRSGDSKSVSISPTT